MNPKKSSKKSIIISIAIVVVAIIAYFYYKGSSPASDSSLTAQPNSEAAIVGTQVLGLLNQIQSLHIDSSIFESPAYQSLRDYSVSIPETNVGRPNPFAPLPGAAPSAPGN